MLLLSAEGKRAREIAPALQTALQTVRNIRKKSAAGGETLLSAPGRVPAARAS
jgi:hypothetical protein